MNKAVLVTLLLLLTQIATAKPASFSERRLFCAEIAKSLDSESADLALDERHCPVNRFISSMHNNDGTTTLQGVVRFNAPNRPTFGLDCAMKYDSRGAIAGTLSCR